MIISRVTEATALDTGDFRGFSRKPLHKTAFQKVETGSVKPTGWLKEQLTLMTNGMAGHLQEISPFLKKENNGWETAGKEGWEEQAYWFRGFYNLAAITGDRRLLQEANRVIELLVASQDEDGYFGADDNKRKKGLDGSVVCDLWPDMIMIDPLIAHYEFTKDSRIIPMLEKFFRFCEGLPDAQFIPGYIDDFGDWHVCVQHDRACEMIPHIHWLYNQIGGAWLLELASRFFRANVPPKDQWLSHHVVNFTQQFRYPGSYFLQSGESWHKQSTDYWYDSHMAIWGQQPGGIFAADELIRNNCTDPRQAFETCAMVEFAKSFYILGRVTGESKYADRCESLFFNHFPAAQTPDLRGIHYLTASNQPILDKSESHEYTNKGPQVIYSPWEIHRCCQHNVTMGWPWFVENLWQKTADGGIAAWMYGPSELSCTIGNRAVRVISETAYPFRSHVNFTVKADAPVRFPFYLRVPEWCSEMTVSYDDTDYSVTSGVGYLRLEELFQPDAQIRVEFTVKPAVVRWPRNGSASIQRGPLFYSLKIPESWQACGGTGEWPEYEVLPDADWNYGLLQSALDDPESWTVTQKGFVEGQPWTVENAPVELKIKGKKIPGWGLENNTVEELRNSPVSSPEPEEELTLVPLGCARLRIACFPVVTEDAPRWEKTQVAHLPDGVGVAYTYEC